MGNDRLWKPRVQGSNSVVDRLRSIARWRNAVSRSQRSLLKLISRRLGFSSVDLHTIVTFRAITDAVIPETPKLGAELGPEHIPGGLAIDLDKFVITYVDNGFQLGSLGADPAGKISLTDIVSQSLEFLSLKIRGRDESIQESPIDESEHYIELSPKRIPTELAINLDESIIKYVDHRPQLDSPDIGPHGLGLPGIASQGEIPLASIISHILDVAALKLLDRGENTAKPRIDRPLSLLKPGDVSPGQIKNEAGMFSQLSRKDRLRAISVLDEFEIELILGEDKVFEFDAGLVGQLVVGFTEMIYYSEWQGYDEFTQAPSKRVHLNDSSAIQSWQQTGYPGITNGYAALRGYIGTDEGTLGDGEIWKTIDEDVTSPIRIRYKPGRFNENDYDTTDYEEPYPE